MRKNRKWIKEETSDASKNRKYIFGIDAQPFLSLSVLSVVSREKNIWLFIQLEIALVFGQFSYLHPWSDLARDIKLGSFKEHIVYDL